VDHDGRIDVPVGRLPARSVKQLRGFVEKTIAYESRPPCLEDLRLPIWAGRAEYGAIVDSLTTSLLLGNLRARALAWTQPWVLCADDNHALCGWPPDQAEQFSGQMKRGGFLSVLIGHGLDNHFYSMMFRDQPCVYTARDARKWLSNGEPLAPLLIITCYCGNFAGPDECLAESLLGMAGGPVAVIAATCESHPLTNYFTGQQLLQTRPAAGTRLGNLWLDVQRKAILARNPLLEKAFLNVEGSLEETVSLEKLRRDHILMYALLGDPAIRLKFPEELHGTLKEEADGWHWTVGKPAGADRLLVSFRSEEQVFPHVEKPLERTASLARLEQANTAFAFDPLAELNGSQSWQGTVTQQGILRLVATGPGRVYVAALKLNQPTQKLTQGN
jgi:hypothetical protein